MSAREVTQDRQAEIDALCAMDFSVASRMDSAQMNAQDRILRVGQSVMTPEEDAAVLDAAYAEVSYWLLNGRAD